MSANHAGESETGNPAVNGGANQSGSGSSALPGLSSPLPGVPGAPEGPGTNEESAAKGSAPAGVAAADQTRERGPDRRRNVVDRRPFPTGLERRRGPGRRRSDFIKSAEEGQMNPEQFLFVMAIDAYKRVNQKPFPTWTEVLEVIRKLGYRKTCASGISMSNCEDWLEKPDAPAFPPALALVRDKTEENSSED